ncbi:hypothetical protein FB45DRAFT_472308 [Roridomyces roridus]|uniref:F-box domain-containing protein n=1 Tax=Roridomyces roridus TaxID=1738132 RepID=A0AAD7FNV8_9AGAR|nr:hypothetical protein FB45DRAFT_472308 [Roridomyces roridus]
MPTQHSPFSSKFGTNYSPTDAEVAEIRALLVEPRQRIQGLNDKIAEMQKAIDKVAAERDSIGSYVQPHEDLLSPIRRIPAEVMSEIFVACLPTHRNCVMSAREAPILLGRICSAWRTLSHATPRLWSSLHIVDHAERPREPGNLGQWQVAFSDDDPRFAMVPGVVQTWLARSGQCPLSISVRGDITLPPTQHVIEILLTMASRWEHVQFTARSAFLNRLIELTPADVPLLRSITLQQYGEEWNDIPFVWDDLKMLRKVTNVSVVGRNLVLARLGVDWSLLTTFSNRRIPGDMARSGSGSATVQGALAIVQRCSQLRDLSLEIDDSSVNQQVQPLVEQPPFLVEHPLLQTLYITGSITGTSFDSLLDRLAVPQLTTLTFLLFLRVAPQFPPNLAPTVSTQGLVRFLGTLSLLESIHLTTSQFDPSSIPEILRSLPASLEKLRLDVSPDPHRGNRSSFDDGILDVITPMPGQPTPLPALRVLQIDGSPSISDEALIRCIVARQDKLKSVKMQFSRARQLNIHAELAPLIKNGLKLSVYHIANGRMRPFIPWDGLPDMRKMIIPPGMVPEDD